jgi:glucosamine--fructose-6-phosphate aminotransferase (isomerizing)
MVYIPLKILHCLTLYLFTAATALGDSIFMCGIVGIISQDSDVALDILDGLRRLEYRGYDSAGIATLTPGGLHRQRAEGKLRNLERLLEAAPLLGRVGIGHTRWATHGAPNEANAHPHATAHVAVVHNGIIENFLELRSMLQARGCVFTSQTDTEVVAHLLSQYIEAGASPEEAVRQTLPQLRGAFALAILFTAHPDILIGARRGSPLVVGYGNGATYLGSDALALASLTQKVSYLEEEDWVVCTPKKTTIYDASNTITTRPQVLSGLSGAMIGKGQYKHFMAKEIAEQPTVLGDSLQALLDPIAKAIRLPALPNVDIHKVREIRIVACGTSYHAGLVARGWLEMLTGIRVGVDIASEYRYRPFVDDPQTLALFISQSGETADTLAALRFSKTGGCPTVAIVNVPTSTMAREAHVTLNTHAGPEIGVASTKAFTAQLIVLAAFAVALGEAKKSQESTGLLQELLSIPDKVNQALSLVTEIEALAADIAEAHTVLFIGRGAYAALALEGALKLKEISYIHAEGLAAGELKHGSIALIDESVPVIVLAPHDRLFEKTISNLQEVVARGGRVVLITDAAGAAASPAHIWKTLVIPHAGNLAAPIIISIPLQLLAYSVAVRKGTDVDQPRNLAKSVTVE